jgi:HEPN domain-containing protein
MRLESLISEWLNLGRQDLDSASYLMNMRPVPLEVVGFLCQQSVEKHLKAYLSSRDIEPDKTHDLVFLVRQCETFDPGFSSLTEICVQLTKYAVKTRYPHPGVLDETSIGNAVAMAAEAITFIKNKLSMQGNF